MTRLTLSGLSRNRCSVATKVPKADIQPRTPMGEAMLRQLEKFPLVAKGLMVAIGKVFSVHTGEEAMASSLIGKQAIVVGAGMGGLAAAGAIAENFERVVVVERDVLPAE